MRFGKFINKVLHWVGSPGRKLCEDRLKEVMNRDCSGGELVLGVTMVYGEELERNSIIDSMEFVFKRRPYLVSLVKRAKLIVVFDDSDFQKYNSHFNSIIIDKRRHFSQVQLSGYIIFAAVKVRCLQMGVPQTWVSRKQIFALGERYWRSTCF